MKFRLDAKGPTSVSCHSVEPSYEMHIESYGDVSTDLESGKRLAQFSFSVLFDLVSKKSKFHESQA